MIYLYIVIMKKIFIFLILLFSSLLFSNQIKIVYPNGGETFFLNKDMETIKWTADKEVGDVVIILYQNGIKLFEIQKIVKSKPNLNIQSFLWRYTPQIKEGSGYRIRIRSLKDFSINDFSDIDFSIKRK